MKLSIVATLYQSASYIAEFHQRASAVARQLVGDDYEIILVNDGSPDTSLDLAVQLTESDCHVVVVDLSRNFGHHKAMMTGLSNASGERVFLIDTDLEEEPEWLLSFMEQMEREKCDVVYGVQERRRGGWFERISGEWFYRLLNFVSGMNLPQHMVTARLMTRRYVAALLLHEERELFIVGVWHLTGFDQQPQAIRKHGFSESTYTFHKKISLAVNAITSFSNAPLVWIFNIGAFIAMAATFFVGYLVLSWFFVAKPPSGWTSVLASIWLVGGMVICFIGVVGIYLSKMFIEIKQRPYTIVREIYKSGLSSKG
ncbi:MAG: glycosyltransferase [Azonexus sp.]|nr:glycosyltransferase [Azonexus sp.]